MFSQAHPSSALVAFLSTQETLYSKRSLVVLAETRYHDSQNRERADISCFSTGKNLFSQSHVITLVSSAHLARVSAKVCAGVLAEVPAGVIAGVFAGVSEGVSAGVSAGKVSSFQSCLSTMDNVGSCRNSCRRN